MRTRRFIIGVNLLPDDKAKLLCAHCRVHYERNAGTASRSTAILEENQYSDGSIAYCTYWTDFPNSERDTWKDGVYNARVDYPNVPRTTAHKLYEELEEQGLL